MRLKLSKKNDNLSSEQDRLVSEIEKLERDLSMIEKAQKESERKWHETLRKQGKKLSDEDFREYNALRSQVASKTGSVKAKLDNYTRQMKTDQVAVNSLKVKVASAQVTVERLQSEHREISERKATTEALVKDLSKSIDMKKKELNQIISERIRINQLHTEKEEKLRALLKEIADADAGQRRSQKEQKQKRPLRR